MNQFIKIIVVSVLLLATASCGKDFLEPIDQGLVTREELNELAGSSPEAVLAIATGTVNGAYSTLIDNISSHDDFGLMAMGLAGDLMTDDMVQTASHFFIYDYQIDNRGANYRRVASTWTALYTVVSKANEVIGTIPPPPDTENKSLLHVLGQAHALRGMALHILLQRFQQTYVGNEEAPGIPIYLTAHDEGETDMSRVPVKQVYDRIESDLLLAQGYLDGFERTTKMAINQHVVEGFLARVYLVKNEWSKASQYAKMARQGALLMSKAECAADGFGDINNKEWMWGADITGQTTTMFASFFSHICSFEVGYGGSVGAYKAIDKKLFDQIGMNDARRTHFKVPGSVVDATSDRPEVKAPIYTNLKFKKVDGWLADYVYMRSAEMYLIEAEALARSGANAEAATVLKELMQNRDPDWNKTTVTADEVFLQKRIELWGEGQIFYDYMRNKLGVHRDYVGSNHLVKLTLEGGDKRFIYRLPQTEIDNNPELSEKDQNE